MNADSIAYRLVGESSCKLRPCSPGYMRKFLPVGSRPFLIDEIKVVSWRQIIYFPRTCKLETMGMAPLMKLDTDLPADPRQDKKNARCYSQGSPSGRALRFASL